MSGKLGTRRYAVFVVPGADGWHVSCSCGYLVTHLQTQQLAQAYLDNHWQRCHASRDYDA